MVKHRQLAPTVEQLLKDQQKNSMASFVFNFPAIDARTTFVFGSWACITDRSGGFSSCLIDPASTKTLRQEQLGETTSAEILLPGIAEEVEGLFLSDTTLTCFPLRLRNSTASYSAFLRQRNLTGTRTAPRFDSYPDSDDDFDLDSDPLNCPNLTILATPGSRVVYWKDSESTGAFSNARLVACLRDLPYQSGRPLLTVLKCHFHPSSILNNKGKLHALFAYLYH